MNIRPVMGGLGALLALFALGTAGDAAGPVFWQVSTQTDLLKGDVENLSIDLHGRLVLGPATDRVHESTAPFLWTLYAAPDGSLFIGSGNEGKVTRIDPSGKASTFFDSSELEVHAIAAAPDNGLFVATSPEGKVYKLDAAGKSTVFFDPDDKYIWSLVVDGDGTLFVATGEKGVIYRVGKDGTGEPYYRTKTTHAMTLAFDQAGNLIAGTGTPGKVFRIDRERKGFVLLDSTFQEIHAVRVGPGGAVYAAAMNGRTGPSEDRPTIEPPRGEPRSSGGGGGVPTVTTEITSISIVDVSVPSVPQAPSREDRRSPRGAVYRINPDGLWDLLWESRDDSPYDVTFDPNGTVLVGTGPDGKIFRLSGPNPGKAELLTRAAAQQVTAFAKDGKGRPYLATANPGKVLRLTTDRADRGSYESEVRDARAVSTWGTVSWRASTPGRSSVEVFTRSGNTSTPDETWSDWAGPYTEANGSSIRSPKARYLQWKAVLTGKEAGPVLTSVTATYLQRNVRPEVTALTVHPAGTVFQKPFSTGELEIAGYDDSPPDRKMLASTGSSTSSAPSGSGATSLGRRIYQKGLQTFVWKAEDDNEDELQYDVFYRREGETTWKPLKRNLPDTIFVWDTTSVPNGTYFTKIVASDAASNPSGTALTGEIESTAFDVDNTPPTISVTGVRRDGPRTIMAFDVRDDHSSVQRVEYSLDADRWRVVYPKDGMADSRFEQFELALEGDVAAKGVIIRAVDGMNNVATGRGEVPARTR